MSDDEFVTKFDMSKPRMDDTDVVFYGMSVVQSAAAVELANNLGFRWLADVFVSLRWRRGVVVSTLVSINFAALHQVRLLCQCQKHL